MSADGHDHLDVLRRQRRTTGIFTDFDGTLSPMVSDPADAAPAEGAVELLEELSHHFGVVAVVSGRPVSFLAAHLPPTLLLSGLYGLETQRDGRLHLDPEGERWRPAVDEAVDRCRAAGLVGLVVEPKGLSLTLHYRSHPDLEAAAVALADRVATETGLVRRSARMSVELHPPVAADKGTAIEALVEGLSAACYLGDDLGDLTAFRALDDLAARGVDTVKVAAVSDESPDELLRRADVAVAGPSGAVELLRRLLP